MATIKFVTKPCTVCSRTSTLELDADAFEKWRFKGVYVQNAFPAMSADQRELLITGTHGPCWDKLMGSKD
jgi:hypothetical protein